MNYECMNTHTHKKKKKKTVRKKILNQKYKKKVTKYLWVKCSDKGGDYVEK